MSSNKITMSSLFICIGVILPFIFHQFGIAGKIFLPMHIPILVTGFLLGRRCGLVVGIITPIFSSLLTGMPLLFPNLVIMIFELSVYGYLTGYLYIDMNIGIYKSLLTSMLLGKLVSIFIAVLLINNFIIAIDSVIKYANVVFIIALPGIIIQLLIVPKIVKHFQFFIK